MANPGPRAPHREHEHHIVPLPVYFAVFGALMLGTLLTVWAAHMDFGWMNTPVALGIACTKAALVVLFFMHVKYSPRLIGLVAAAALLWLAILVFITLSDYWTRGLLGTPGS